MSEERPAFERPPQAQSADEFREWWDLTERTSMARYLAAIEERFIVDSIAGRPQRPRLALDAGAGRGRLTALLAKHADRVVATETEQKLVELLEKVAPNVTSVLADPEVKRLPLEDASADWIISIQAADLAESQWFQKECARALTPGGVLVVNLQNRRSWKGLVARRRAERYRAEFGAIYYSSSLENFTRDVEAAGLEVEQTVGYNWLPFTRDSDSRLIGPLGAIEGALGLRRLGSISPWVLVRMRRPLGRPAGGSP